MGSILYMHQPPENGGGDTLFANMYVAYEKLSDSMKAYLKSLTAVHDGEQVYRGRYGADTGKVFPRNEHPIVRTHPVTRRKCLFLGRRRAAYVVGLPLAESEALLDQLWVHATQPALCWTQVWREGDVVVWDNRCVLHRRDDFDDRYRRVMHRTQICGDRPF